MKRTIVVVVIFSFLIVSCCPESPMGDMPEFQRVETPSLKITPVPQGITPTAEETPDCWEGDLEGWKQCVEPQNLGFSTTDALFASALVVAAGDPIPFDGIIVAAAWSGTALVSWALVNVHDFPMISPGTVSVPSTLPNNVNWDNLPKTNIP
jgi:hypothetical protein